MQMHDKSINNVSHATAQRRQSPNPTFTKQRPAKDKKIETVSLVRDKNETINNNNNNKKYHRISFSPFAFGIFTKNKYYYFSPFEKHLVAGRHAILTIVLLTPCERVNCLRHGLSFTNRTSDECVHLENCAQK